MHTTVRHRDIEAQIYLTRLNINLYLAFSEVYGYDVSQNLPPGEEYDVVVGVTAARSVKDAVVANSSVRTFIPVPGIYIIMLIVGYTVALEVPTEN